MNSIDAEKLSYLLLNASSLVLTVAGCLLSANYQSDSTRYIIEDCLARMKHEEYKSFNFITMLINAKYIDADLLKESRETLIYDFFK